MRTFLRYYSHGKDGAQGVKCGYKTNLTDPEEHCLVSKRRWIDYSTDINCQKGAPTKNVLLARNN